MKIVINERGYISCIYEEKDLPQKTPCDWINGNCIGVNCKQCPARDVTIQITEESSCRWWINRTRLE